MWILSPLSWLLLASLAGIWAHRRRITWLGRVSVAVALVAVLATTPMVANALVAWLESPQPASSTCASDPPSLALVLAGGVDAAPRNRDDYAVLNDASRRRVEKAVEWWQQRPGRTLVMAGGPSETGAIAPADLMAAYARRLGVRHQSLAVERQSTTTCENAREFARLHPRLPRRAVLITSAMHMRRARYAAQVAGFDACPMPSDTRLVPFGIPGSLIPRTSALAKSEAAVHELVGMPHYRWRCRPAAQRKFAPTDAAGGR